MPQFENKFKIVNFHDDIIVKSFYCDVLKAERACRLETERCATLRSRTKASAACFDLTVRNHWSRHAEFSLNNLCCSVELNIVDNPNWALLFE